MFTAAKHPCASAFGGRNRPKIAKIFARATRAQGRSSGRNTRAQGKKKRSGKSLVYARELRESAALSVLPLRRAHHRYAERTTATLSDVSSTHLRRLRRTQPVVREAPLGAAALSAAPRTRAAHPPPHLRRTCHAAARAAARRPCQIGGAVPTTAVPSLVPEEAQMGTGVEPRLNRRSSRRRRS